MFKIIDKDHTFDYKGLRIMANPDLHASVIEVIKNLKIESDSRILILGAGTGAFDRRLLDSGFTDITSVDIAFENYQIEPGLTKFIKADLNDEFADTIENGVFDLIICMEVVEHVYSPFHLIKGCNRLLTKDGFILLSTPNVHDDISRVHNVLFGYPSLFLSDPEEFDHVSPIYKKILKHYLRQNNLKLIKNIPISHFFNYLQIYSLRSYIYYLVVFIIWICIYPILFFSRERMNGLLTLYVIKKQ